MAWRHVDVDTAGGAAAVARVSAEQLFVSRDGAINGRYLTGRIEFHTSQGGVDIRESSGFASGRSERGDIMLRMREWRFADKALVESARGNITLALPPTFSGEVDVWSGYGKTRMGFPIQTSREPRAYGPEPANHIYGRVGDGGEQLKVFSQEGDVEVISGK